MNSLKPLAIVGLVCVMQGVLAGDVEHVSSWGETEVGSVFSVIKSKVAIPFLHRDTEIVFPGVSQFLFC